MPMSDKFKITLKVADLNPLAMIINRPDEETVRTAEYLVNRAWDRWMASRSPSQDSKDVLGMVALHYTRNYVQQSKLNDDVERRLKEVEDKLDELLLKID